MSPPLRTGPDRVWRWQRFPRQRAGRFDSAASNWICTQASCARQACSSGLQEQSLKVLAELVEQPGDLVTREQLRQRLWPNGTFVDFEHGLNAVINRLRETLGDSAESPRFIQTVPRRGYRFIAPVEGAVQAPAVVPRHADRARLHETPHAYVDGGRSASVSPWLVRGRRALAALRRLPRSKAHRRESCRSRGWRARKVAGIRAGRRTGRLRWSGEKFDNTDIYVTLVGVDKRSAADDESRRRLRPQLVA